MKEEGVWEEKVQQLTTNGWDRWWFTSKHVETTHAHYGWTWVDVYTHYRHCTVSMWAQNKALNKALTNGNECIPEISRHFSFNGVDDVTFSQLGGRRRMGEEGQHLLKYCKVRTSLTADWNIVGLEQLLCSNRCCTVGKFWVKEMLLWIVATQKQAVKKIVCT